MEYRKLYHIARDAEERADYAWLKYKETKIECMKLARESRYLWNKVRNHPDHTEDPK